MTVAAGDGVILSRALRMNAACGGPPQHRSRNLRRAGRNSGAMVLR